MCIRDRSSIDVYAVPTRHSVLLCTVRLCKPNASAFRDAAPRGAADPDPAPCRAVFLMVVLRHKLEAAVLAVVAAWPLHVELNGLHRVPEGAATPIAVRGVPIHLDHRHGGDAGLGV
eukprot:TRINITY_DN1704_c0_g1_i1.p3 TRINITY_DN1704_c0_g1~~TRINITY_DN1704_c0_g1_i1.p3  ORF type:complete len:117 (-),score=15.57 TRINITY_DN1704_c0_g1_i1:238-588(-)